MSSSSISAGKSRSTESANLISVGVDIGSATTHLSLSELEIGSRDSFFYRKPEVLSRRLIYRSPIIFTPYAADGAIDHVSISEFVNECYRDSGIVPEAIDVGAVICTGEAAKKKNAEAITSAIARDSGRFVCATAGHHFESVLAAHGSGAVELSHHADCAVVNLDIGGGTAKRTFIRNGTIVDCTAINVGARLLAFDATGVVQRCEEAGALIARARGIEVKVGTRLSEDDLQTIAHTCVDLLLEFIGLFPVSDLGRSLLLTSAPEPLQFELISGKTSRAILKEFWLVCSGGVSEFLYSQTDLETGDLGPLIGAALRLKLPKHIPENWIRHPCEGLRATVIGANQYSLQVSGETIFVSQECTMPLSNLQVISTPINWSSVSADLVYATLRSAICSLDNPDANVAFHLGGPKAFGYGRIAALAEGVARALNERTIETVTALVFSHDVANIVGYELEKRLSSRHQFVCIDELALSDFDFIDIGPRDPVHGFVPVVVKTLLFAGCQDSPTTKLSLNMETDPDFPDRFRI
jgi:ethanolamine utilization protein EutA